MTIEITFRTGPTGTRYALYRIKGWNALTWHGMSLAIAEAALRDGVVSLGRFKGALAVPALEHETARITTMADAGYPGVLSTERQSLKARR